MIRKILLGLALAWVGLALLAEMERAVSGYDQRDRLQPGAMGWRFGIPQVVRLERFLEAARPLLPAGARVAFTSPPAASDEIFFRHRWAAYLLPEVDLIPREDPAGATAPYVLSYSYHLNDPHLRLTRRLPGGFLYQAQSGP